MEKGKNGGPKLRLTAELDGDGLLKSEPSAHSRWKGLGRPSTLRLYTGEQGLGTGRSNDCLAHRRNYRHCKAIVLCVRSRQVPSGKSFEGEASASADCTGARLQQMLRACAGVSSASRAPKEAPSSVDPMAAMEGLISDGDGLAINTRLAQGLQPRV